MKWLKGNKEHFNQVELINAKEDKYSVKLSPRDYTPVKTEESGESDTSNVEYLEVIDCGIQSTAKLKEHLLNLLIEYDSSDEVNLFYYQGVKKWIAVNTRNSVYHSCELLEKTGVTDYTLWIDDKAVSIPITIVKAFLSELENYALTCFNKTKEHEANINQLKTRKDILEYNISDGYPTPINFDNYLQ